jgi:hypothetical protein
MALECYRNWNPKGETLDLVEQCVAITQEYMEQGYVLTLRQLYYQLVSRDVVPNTEKSYRKVGQYCTRARLAGMMDWDAIEDRVRRPHRHIEFRDLEERVEAALDNYRLCRWNDQPHYTELWVEKDALASVLEPLADEYHVTLMVNRGYSSSSAMKDSAERFREYDGNRECFLFYLGDLDPSGEDMVRDIATRMQEFMVSPIVEKIALTIEQVRHFNPPPNPAKQTDPRAAAFVARYGASSWEVDALPPRELVRIIRSSLDRVVDKKRMKAVVAREELDKARLREAVAELLHAED